MYLAACFKNSQSKEKNAKKTSWQTLDNTLFTHTTHVIQDTEPCTDIPVQRHQHALLGICSLRRQFQTSQDTDILKLAPFLKPLKTRINMNHT